jgi:transposase
MEFDWLSPHDWMEWRRVRALQLKQDGWKQRSIAAVLDVSEGAVSRWLSTARRGGAAALCSRPRRGAIPMLTPAQRDLIPDYLWLGTEAYGFRGEVWTCARVAHVIEEEFGVSYSKSQVSRILKDWDWTPQIPITRAIQRDEETIEPWRVEVWPELKKRARRERRTLVFVDEAGFYLVPGVVKTYSPKGITPVIDEWQTRDHLSVVGAVIPKGKVYTLVGHTALNGLDSIAFLDHLVRAVPQRLLVIWDRSPIHRRIEVQDYVAEVGVRKIHLEPLPPYAPDLNPVEWMWQHLKHVELRNLACVDLEELHLEFHLAVGRIRSKPKLIQSFFAGAGLEL